MIWLTLLLMSTVALGQDIRLLDIESVYIIPNGDEKETCQFEEKISKQLGWTVTPIRSEADALLVFRQGPSGATVGVATGPYSAVAIPVNLKVFELFTNEDAPELLFTYKSGGSRKIAGRAVGKIKKAIEKLSKQLEE